MLAFLLSLWFSAKIDTKKEIEWGAKMKRGGREGGGEQMWIKCWNIWMTCHCTTQYITCTFNLFKKTEENCFFFFSRNMSHRYTRRSLYLSDWIGTVVARTNYNFTIASIVEYSYTKSERGLPVTETVIIFFVLAILMVDFNADSEHYFSVTDKSNGGAL